MIVSTLVDEGHVRALPRSHHFEHWLERRLGLVNTKRRLFGGSMESVGSALWADEHRNRQEQATRPT